MTDNSRENNFSIEQLDKITLFQEISSINDRSLAIDVLIEHNWDVQISINNFLHGNQNSSSSSSTSSSISRRNGTPRRNNLSNTNNTNIQNERQLTTNTNNNNIFDFMLTPLKWLFTIQQISPNPDIDTRKFIDKFDLTFNHIHPTFYDKSYRSAVSSSFQNSKFLLVYLHSPIHEDTDKFCRQTLCTTTFKEYVDENFIMWSGQLLDPEAYNLSTNFNVVSFPFLAVCVCNTDRQVKIVDRIQGVLDERVITSRLATALTSFGGIITRMREETTRREETLQLRIQQDREYRETEEADRIERIRRQTELDEKNRLEEEAKQQKELDDAIELSKKLTKESKLINLRDNIKPEPTGNTDIAAIRFQLPTGGKITRNFLKNDTIQTLHDFLYVHFVDTLNVEINNFLITTQFPKKEFHDMTKTVEEMGLYPRGMLYIQDLDA